MMATILSRVGPHLSIARWLLCSRFAGLVRYLHPSDEQLREYAPAPKLEKKDKKKQRQAEKNNAPSNGTFSVPRNIDIQLETAPVDLTDVVQLRYYSEYQWLLDFSLYSMVTYIISELYIWFMPDKSSLEANLSLVWVVLVMMVLLVDESTLETGLDKAYMSFNNSAASFLEKNTGLDSSGPASKLVLKFFIALWCGLIG